MEARRTEGIKTEHNERLRKQPKVLESRRWGTASDSKLLEYEVRQEIGEQLCKAYLVGTENDRSTHTNAPSGRRASLQEVFADEIADKARASGEAAKLNRFANEMPVR